MRKFAFEPGPQVQAFVLGPMLETAFRQSLIIFGGCGDFRFAADCVIVPRRRGAPGDDADRRQEARDGECL